MCRPRLRSLLPWGDSRGGAGKAEAGIQGGAGFTRRRNARNVGRVMGGFQGAVVDWGWERRVARGVGGGGDGVS